MILGVIETFILLYFSQTFYDQSSNTHPLKNVSSLQPGSFFSAKQWYQRISALPLFSAAIGCPLPVYFASRRMHNFAYHVPDLPWAFLPTDTPVPIAILLTAGTQFVRIARINTLDVLHYE